MSVGATPNGTNARVWRLSTVRIVPTTAPVRKSATLIFFGPVPVEAIPQ